MKKLQGKVISLKREKTATVEVVRMWAHPLYGKRVKRSKNYSCDYDPKKIELVLNDMVEIEECAPISKTKQFRVIAKIKK